MANNKKKPKSPTKPMLFNLEFKINRENKIPYPNIEIVQNKIYE